MAAGWQAEACCPGSTVPFPLLERPSNGKNGKPQPRKRMIFSLWMTPEK